VEANAEGRTDYHTHTKNNKQKGIKMQSETSITSQVFFPFSSVNKDKQDAGNQGIHVEQCWYSRKSWATY